MRLTGLFVYPIKSCAGLSVDDWALDERGLVGDRSYMVVDEQGRTVASARHPGWPLCGPNSASNCAS